MRIVWATALGLVLLFLALDLWSGGKPREGDTLRTAHNWQMVPELIMIALVCAIMLYSTFE